MARLTLQLAVMAVLFGQAMTTTTTVTTTTPAATTTVLTTTPALTASVAENSTVGTEVLNITTLNPTNMTMQIPDSNPKKFMLSETMLVVANTLDFEMVAMYNVTIVGTDSQNNSATVTVIITITDVNEAPMFGNMTYTANVANGTAGGTIVLNTTATDPDSDQITYGIIGDTDADFMIDDMGKIMVATGKTLSQERKCKYMFMVNATDNGTTPLTGTADVTINVGTCPENSGVRTAASFLCVIAILLCAIL